MNRHSTSFSQTDLFDPLAGILTGYTTPDQGGPGSNENKAVIQYFVKILYWSLTKVCTLVSYSEHFCGGGSRNPPLDI